MITLIIKGTPYKTYESINIKKSMDSLCGTFSFVVVNPDNQPFPAKVDDECQIKIDDTIIINGRIEVINGSYDSKNHTLTVSGRDKTSDVVESLIGGNVQFSTPISLVDIIKRTLSISGIAGIGVINKVGGLEDYSESDVVSAEVGETIFDFLEKYARKRQVILTSDGDSNIVLTRASQINETGYLVNKKNNNKNNIQSASYNYDLSKRFSKYTFWSQLNPASVDSGDYSQIANYKDISTVKSSPSSSSFDNGIHAGKVFNKLSENSSDTNNLGQRASWEANIRKARSFTYSVVMNGYKMPSGKIWDTNLILKVSDEVAGVDSDLLLNSVEFNLTLDGGSTTTLTFMRPDAYIIQGKIDSDLKDKNKNGKAVSLKYDSTVKVTLNNDK